MSTREISYCKLQLVVRNSLVLKSFQSVLHADKDFEERKRSNTAGKVQSGANLKPVLRILCASPVVNHVSYVQDARSNSLLLLCLMFQHTNFVSGTRSSS